MADRKISDLTALTTPASGDYLPIVDISEAAAASKNKRITIEELFRGVPLGTAAAPSIAIEGNENTGVYSPGANQLAVATNGTGRLFVDSTGLVGVGTGSPSANGLVTIAETTNARLYLTDSTLGNAYGGQLRGFAVGGQGGNIELGVVDNNVYSKAITVTAQANDIIFSRGATERMRIDSTGRVGIGTSAPGSPLTIAGNYTGTSNMLELRTTAGGADGGGRIVWKKPQDEFLNSFISSSRVGATSAGQIEFGTAADIYAANATTKMVILGSGNVGIGTTSPTYKLHVSGSTGIIKGESANATFGSPSFSLNDTTHSVEIILTPINGLGAFGTYTNHPLAFYTNNGEKARLDSSGRLLVGTSTDTGGALLQVAGTSIRYAARQRATVENIYQAGAGRVFTITGGFNGDEAHLAFEAFNHNGFVRKRYMFMRGSSNWTHIEHESVVTGTNPTVTLAGNSTPTITVTVVAAGANPTFYAQGSIEYEYSLSYITFA